MKGNYLRRIGGLLLAVLMVSGVVFMSSHDVSAQGRRGRVIIVRPIHRPFGWWGYGWGYDPWYPYGYPYGYYRQYVFDDSDSAVNQGYKDGFKTGKSDGKKDKSYDPERSHYFREAGFGNYAEVYRSGFSHGYRDGYKVGANERAG